MDRGAARPGSRAVSSRLGRVDPGGGRPGLSLVDAARGNRGAGVALNPTGRCSPPARRGTRGSTPRGPARRRASGAAGPDFPVVGRRGAARPRRRPGAAASGGTRAVHREPRRLPSKPSHHRVRRHDARPGGHRRRGPPEKLRPTRRRLLMMPTGEALYLDGWDGRRRSTRARVRPQAAWAPTITSAPAQVSARGDLPAVAAPSSTV